MSELATGTVCIKNPQGLHARPADMFAKTASRFDSTVEVIKAGERVDGKSILSILTLVAEQGTELSIEAKARTRRTRFERSSIWSKKASKKKANNQSRSGEPGSSR